MIIRNLLFLIIIQIKLNLSLKMEELNIIKKFQDTFRIKCLLNVIPNLNNQFEIYKYSRFLTGLLEFDSNLCIEANLRCPEEQKLLFFTMDTPITELNKIQFELCDLDIKFLLIQQNPLNDYEDVLKNIHITMNCRFFITILSNTSNLFEVFRVSSNSALQIIYHQQWNSIKNRNRILSNYYQHRNDFQEHSLKIALNNVPPFTSFKIQNNKTTVDGIMNNYWSIIAEKSKLRIVNVLLENDFGIRTPNGTWTGLIGAVTNGQADISSCIMFKNDRREAGDYLHINLVEKYMIFVKPDILIKNYWDSYFEPFDKTFWIILCLMISIITIVNFLQNWFYNNFESFSFLSMTDSLFYVLSCFLIQCYLNPSGSSSNPSERIARTTLLLLAVFIFYSYSSAIISSLVVDKEHLAFNDLESLMNIGGYIIHCHKDSPAIKLINISSDAQLQRFYKEYILPELNNFPSIPEGLINVKLRSKYGFVAINSLGRSFYKIQQMLTISFPVMENKILLSCLIRKKSPYRRMFNHKFLQIEEVGISHYIKNKYLYQEKEEKNEIKFNSIELSMVAVPLIILICGYLSAIIFILIEVMIRRINL